MEVVGPAVPVESTTNQTKTTRTSDNPKGKLRSPDAKDSKKESAIAQVEYLEKYIAEIGSSQPSPQQIRHLQTMLPQLPACKSKEKLSAQQIKSLIQIAVRGWKKVEQQTQTHNFAVDNEAVPNNNNDKHYKVRPLISAMNANYVNLYNVSQSLSIDESMILFKGRHSIKQYCPKKAYKTGV